MMITYHSVPYFYCYVFSDFFPIEESVDGGSLAPVKMERVKYGGHIGFMFHQSRERPKYGNRPVSWMPLELTRFLSHVHSYG